MATHVITVNYVVDPVTDKGTVDVVPRVTQADSGDTLDFQQKASSAAGRMRITFLEKELFSTKNPQFSATGKFFNGDGLVSVKGRSRKTSFVCELLGPDEKVLVTSTGAGNDGGAIEISDR